MLPQLLDIDVDIPTQPVDKVGFELLFLLVVAFDFPRFAASCFAYFSFALLCCGV
jgi:hypothetical protein